MGWRREALPKPACLLFTTASWTVGLSRAYGVWNGYWGLFTLSSRIFHEVVFGNDVEVGWTSISSYACLS